MNFKKAIEGLGRTRGLSCTIQEALSHPNRWDAYWMLYNTPEAKDASFCYDKWMKYVDYVRSKPE